MWYVELGFQKFIVSIDVTFDEKAMLHSRKESIAINKDHNIDEQMKLEVRPAVHPSYGDTSV